jgi:C4-dicarboxylate transporter, DctM subunit
MIFAAVSGSSVATTFAIGAILIPAMVQNGYPKPTAAAVQASSAELGVLIPPSIPLILYGVATETSIGQLFIAGFGPGLLVAAALIAFLLVYCRSRATATRTAGAHPARPRGGEAPRRTDHADRSSSAASMAASSRRPRPRASPSSTRWSSAPSSTAS